MPFPPAAQVWVMATGPDLPEHTALYCPTVRNYAASCPSRSPLPLGNTITITSLDPSGPAVRGRGLFCRYVGAAGLVLIGIDHTHIQQ